MVTGPHSRVRFPIKGIFVSIFDIFFLGHKLCAVFFLNRMNELLINVRMEDQTIAFRMNNQDVELKFLGKDFRIIDSVRFSFDTFCSGYQRVLTKKLR